MGGACITAIGIAVYFHAKEELKPIAVAAALLGAYLAHIGW